ncbi:MAG TPA: hypothetical protein GXZ86_02170 [Clostridiales bacterium]|jgi:hypothetical protein|nr:hypothetical protein [Clostridiales bacterium]
MLRGLIIYLLVVIVSKYLSSKKKQTNTKNTKNQPIKERVPPSQGQTSFELTAESGQLSEKAPVFERAPRTFQSLETSYSDFSNQSSFEEKGSQSLMPAKRLTHNTAVSQTLGQEKIMAQTIIQGIVWQEILSKPKGLRVGYRPKG